MPEDETIGQEGTTHLDFSWVEAEVVANCVEPTVDQVMNSQRWIVAHWLADLTRNSDYVPSSDVMKALLLRTSSEWRKTADLNSSPEYHEYLEDVLQQGPEAWKEASSLTLEDINQKLGRAGADSLNPANFNINVQEEESAEQDTVKSKYSAVLAKKLESTLFTTDRVVTREEKHPIFPDGLNESGDSDSLLLLSREFGRRMKGTQEGANVASWVLNNLDTITNSTEYESEISVWYLMRDLVGKPNEFNKEFYTSLCNFLASETVVMETFTSEDEDDPWSEESEMYLFKTSEKGQVKMDSSSRWDAMAVMFGMGYTREDMLDGIILAASQLEDTETRVKVLSTIFGEKGPAEVLNYMRKVINDESFTDTERAAAAAVFRSFYENVITPTSESVIPEDIKTFYSLVINNESFMTEGKEGDKRVDLLVRIFEEEGITDELMVDTACGTGWLTEKLEARGYNIIGVDLNPDLIKVAQEKYKNQKYYVAPWDKMEDVPGIEQAKVFMVNGRSIHHLEQFGGFHGMMKQMENAKMIIFDGLNKILQRLEGQSSGYLDQHNRWGPITNLKDWNQMVEHYLFAE